MEMFLTLVLQVLLAVVVAKLTLAASKSQKWWERKADLYANLSRDFMTSAATTGTGSSKTKKMNPHWVLKKKAQREGTPRTKQEGERGTGKARSHRNISDLGESASGLASFQKAERVAKEKYDRWSTYELVCDIYDAAVECIKSVREHSKEDLGLNSWFGRFKRFMRKVQSLLL